MQLRYLGLAGGANGESFWEAQQRVLRETPLTVLVRGGFVRDGRWRPLKAEEALEAQLPMPTREVRNTTDAPKTLKSGAWILAAGEDPANTLDYYWLRHD